MAATAILFCKTTTLTVTLQTIGSGYLKWKSSMWVNATFNANVSNGILLALLSSELLQNR